MAKLSVIIPAYRAERTLPRTLQSLEAAGAGLEVETIVVEDAERRGPSWARNRGLERATGKYVFFVDADDEVRRDFIRVPLAALEETGAEMCMFGFGDTLPRRNYELKGSVAVRSEFLPTVFGYSMDDVRRWNRGGRLWDSREFASVWRFAYRRDFLECHRLRFDERVRFCEDAMFLAECAIRCESMTSVAEPLYVYHRNASGLVAQSIGAEEHWRHKFRMLEFRKRLDALTGGAVWKYCEASCVFSALELLKMRRGGFWRYVRDPAVAEAIRRFPISPRHPLTAAAVLAIRCLASLKV